MTGITHNQYLKLFSDIAIAHKNINSFGSGDLWEYMANEGATVSPVTLWVMVQPDSIDGKTDKPKYSFLVMDAVDKGEENEDEVISDTLRIAKDIVALLRQPYYEGFFTFEQNITFDPFTERFDSEMSGWQFDITFNQPFLYDACQVNIDGLPAINMDSIYINTSNARWGQITGTLSNQTDLQSALDAKVPTSRELTINGTTFDLSANRTWTISTAGQTLAQTLVLGNNTGGSPIQVDDADYIQIGTIDGGTLNYNAVSNYVSFINSTSSDYIRLTDTGGIDLKSLTGHVKLETGSHYINVQQGSGIVISGNSGDSSITLDEATGNLNVFSNAKIKLDSVAVNISQQAASRVAIIDSSNNLISANTATYPSLTELAFVKGLSSNAQTQITSKESAITAGTTTQYWRGDKVFQTLDTLAVTENTNLYFTTGRVNTQVATYTGDVTLSGTAFSIGASKVTNTMLAGSIAYGKLSLTNSIVSGDIVSLAWSKITGTPTTVSGYGITDAATATSATAFTNKSGNISQWTNDSGYLTSLSGAVLTSRTLTINGTTQDLSANRTWTVGDALVANPLSQFASTTSAQLLGIISDETGTGSLVFGTTPTFTTNITTTKIIGGTAVASVVDLVASTNASVTTTATAHEWWIGNNGATSAGRIYQNGNLNFGNATTGNQRIFQIGQDTAFVSIGSRIGTASQVAFYGNQATPSASNWFIRTDGTDLALNGTSGNISLQTNNTNRYVVATTTGVHTRTTANMTGGSAIYFNDTAGNTTTATASTAIPKWKLTLGTCQWATGAGPTAQPWFHITQGTGSAVGASTFPIQATAYIEGAVIAGANMTQTLTAGLYIDNLNSVSSAGTSYGAYIKAQTGGTANHALGLAGTLQMLDTDIVLGTTTGTKIGTATSQKLAFFNKTPIVQPTTSITPATYSTLGGAGIGRNDTIGNYTVEQAITALINLGVLA